MNESIEYHMGVAELDSSGNPPTTLEDAVNLVHFDEMVHTIPDLEYGICYVMADLIAAVEQLQELRTLNFGDELTNAIATMINSEKDHLMGLLMPVDS